MRFGIRAPNGYSQCTVYIGIMPPSPNPYAPVAWVYKTSSILTPESPLWIVEAAPEGEYYFWGHSTIILGYEPWGAPITTAYKFGVNDYYTPGFPAHYNRKFTPKDGVLYDLQWWDNKITATGEVLPLVPPPPEEVPPEEPTYECPYCGAAFFTEKARADHMASCVLAPPKLSGELVVAYALWEGKEGWNEIVTSPSYPEISYVNIWPANTKVTTRWKVKNTGSEGAFFKVRLLGLPEAVLPDPDNPPESVAVWLDPNKEAELYLYPITPGPGWATYGYILDVMVKAETTYQKVKSYVVGITGITKVEPGEPKFSNLAVTYTRA